MRNFQQLASGLDVVPLLHEVARQPELWNQYKVRTSHSQSAHRTVDDILLRYSKFDSGDDFIEKVCSEIAVVDYPAWYKLPEAHKFIFGTMQRVGGVHLGRVMISRVRPGVEIPLHSDRIEPAETLFPSKVPPAVYYERYHVVLNSAPGVVFDCGDESLYMSTGTAWWFNNQVPHRVINNSAEDRIHLVMDIRCAHDNYIPK